MDSLLVNYIEQFPQFFLSVEGPTPNRNSLESFFDSSNIINVRNEIENLVDGKLADYKKIKNYVSFERSICIFIEHLECSSSTSRRCASNMILTSFNILIAIIRASLDCETTAINTRS